MTLWNASTARTTVMVTACLAGAVLLSNVAHSAWLDFLAASDQSSRRFVETRWDMPVDPWGNGRAYVCDASACGTEVKLYARTKAGFCNCYLGVANDDEIDLIGDVDIHGEDFRPVAEGQVTSIGELQGRYRPFEATSHNAPPQNVMSIVVSEDCKAIVATLVSKKPITQAAESAARAVLTDKPFRQWAAAQQTSPF